MANFNIIGKSDKFFKSLEKALRKGLSKGQLKTQVTNAAKVEIDNVVQKAQNRFRPDKGPGGGDELVGQLGIGKGGSPQTEKYRGGEAAFKLLEPTTAIAPFSSSFVAARKKFGIINYDINIDLFYGHFKSNYASDKTGDATHDIPWVKHLIEGIPTEALRDNPIGSTFAFVDSGPAFNPNFSRTGLGHMVNIQKLRIPARQFEFGGRGRPATFGFLFEQIEKGLSSPRFKSDIEKRIARIINSGG